MVTDPSDQRRDLIRRFMKARGFTGNGWCTAAGISESTLRNFLKGRGRTMNIATYRKLAAAAGVGVAELIGEDSTAAGRAAGGGGEGEGGLRRAPLLSWVAAGSFTDMAAPSDLLASDLLATESVPTAWPKDTVFALRVSGDSMNKVAPDGSIVIVDYTRRDPEDNRLYIFRRDGAATFKRYRCEGGEVWIEPDSTNRRHQPIFPDPGNEPGQEFEVIGAVVEIHLPE